MKLRTHFPLSRLFLAAMLLPAASYAQFEGKTCTDIPASTNAVPSPGTGTFTVEGLTKFGLPAKSCATIGAFSGSTIDFDFTTTLATRYNNATFPSTCAGITYGLNGGPTYTAVTGKGKFAFDLTKPTAGVTGTLTATAFSQTDNLTLSAGGSNFVINTGLLALNTTVTINADQSVDIKICTPKGGIPATVNGSSFTVPTSVWTCLAQPTPIQNNVRVTYVEGC
jgi:hypothetical protein